ncbi:MAG: DUF732 domain-containing protein [Actinomycetes bacterium]
MKVASPVADGDVVVADSFRDVLAFGFVEQKRSGSDLANCWGQSMSIFPFNAKPLVGSIAVLVVGLSVATPAYADDTQDQIYLTSLGIRNISCASLPGCGGNDQLLSLGHGLCTDLSKVGDPLVEANYLMSNWGFSKAQAAGVLGSAIGAYCPEWVPVLHQAAGN